MRIALLACLVACMTACVANTDDPEAVGDDLAPIVTPRTHVIEAEPGVDVEVRGDSLVFPAPLRGDVAERANGDVIVSGRGAGFLRRIVGRHDEGNRVVVETAPTELSDVFEQMQLRGSLTNDGANTTHTSALETMGKRISLPPLNVHDVHVPLPDGSSLDIVEGLFELSPDIDVDMTLRRRKIDKFKLTVGAETRGLLKVRYHLNPGLSKAKGKEDHKIASMPTKYITFWVGWVPVVVAVHVDLEAGAELKVSGEVSGEASLEANGSMTTGLEYSGGRFQDRSSSSMSVKAGAGKTKLSQWGGSGEITLTAKISVELYDLAGPFVGLESFAGLNLGNDGSGKNLYGELGIRGVVGAEAGIFGRSFTYQKTIFQKSVRTPN